MNDMDFLNSFHGCQVVEYCVTKRFKGQVEGKKRYSYGVLFLLLLDALILTGTFLLLMFHTIGGTQPLIIDKYIILSGICFVVLVVVGTYYKNHSFMIHKYTIRWDEELSEEDKKEIQHQFYVKEADYLDKGRRSTDLFFAYPKEEVPNE